MGTLSRKAVWGAALALWVMIPAASASAASGGQKVDKLLQEASSSGSPRRVIIRTRPEGTDRVKKRLPHRRSGPAEHKLISALSADMDAKEIAALANDPDVLSVSSDADVTGTAATSSAAQAAASVNLNQTGTMSGLKKLLGIQDWFNGSSVTVAVIDSGIQNSIDFDGRIVGSYDFTVGNSVVATAPIDEYGHGTHIAGLIGSSGASSGGKYAGVVAGVKLLSLKVLDKKGSGRTSSVIRALEFAVANKDRFGIRIVNLSLGHPIFESAASDPLVQAVEAAVRSGLIVVTAAGNFGTNPETGLVGYAGIASPGNAPSAITVGASNAGNTVGRGDDRVAPYSSRGPSWYDGMAKPDVVAPGANLLSNRVEGSTLAKDYPSLLVTDNTARLLRLNGSSMAAGVVSGLAAAMLEANNYGGYLRWQYLPTTRRPASYPGVPTLTANAVKAMLQYSATPLRNADGQMYDALTQGSGEVNGYGVLTLAGSADTTKPTGSFWMSMQWPTETTFGGVIEQWSETLTWGTRLMRGSSLIDINQTAYAKNIVWGTGEMGNIVWGTAALGDDNIVWGTLFGGDNIVWGTLFGGDNIVWGTLFGGNAQFADNIVWGTAMSWDDNIVWGTGLLGVFNGDNIVWGTMKDGADNIVWGTLSDDNIVWGTSVNKVLVLGSNGGGL
jgi:serine protease AprX